jgi:hypothetical protein
LKYFFKFELSSTRLTHSMQIPKGTKVTTDGRFYFFHINYDAIKFMLGEADQVKY